MAASESRGVEPSVAEDARGVVAGVALPTSKWHRRQALARAESPCRPAGLELESRGLTYERVGEQRLRLAWPRSSCNLFQGLSAHVLAQPGGEDRDKLVTRKIVRCCQPQATCHMLLDDRPPAHRCEGETACAARCAISAEGEELPAANCVRGRRAIKSSAGIRESVGVEVEGD